MTVVDRLRAARPGRPDGRADDDAAPPRGRPLLVGLATGTGSLLLVLVPCLLVRLVEPRAGGTVSGAFEVGAALWLLLGGGHLAAGGASISLVPLLGTLLLVRVARAGAREAVLDAPSDGAHVIRLLPRGVTGALLQWWVGYALVVTLAWLLAARGPFPPVGATSALPALVVPAAGAAWALRALARDDARLLGPLLRRSWLPDSIRRGLAPGLAGAGLLLAVGAALVLLAVGVGHDRVLAVHGALEPALAGSVLLVTAQLGYLPNLALWAVSFLAGPGFQLVEGGAVTSSGVGSGLLPMVPVLGALPQPRALPWVVPVACALVVVGCGAWVGRRALGAVARLARLRTKLVVASSACATTALGLALLDVLAGGSAGQFRLSDVGVPAGRLALALFAQLLVGAVAVVLRDAWRLRR